MDFEGRRDPLRPDTAIRGEKEVDLYEVYSSEAISLGIQNDKIQTDHGGYTEFWRYLFSPFSVIKA